ncbi:MAG: thiamine/thiamine pyrophosphate ABC transporter permease ThiP [Alphaproteobacteria bacterium]|nr:thiamine/thiamine pyrophosphate ABC transporter permease ThiP [Alphaproteobacteria bacterium]
MAERSGAIRPSTTPAPALLALALVLGALGLGFLPVLWLGIGGGVSAFDPYLGRVLRFTLLQAGLSTLMSISLGLLLARALARQQFPGRTILVRLLNLPLALPAIVVIIGIIDVYGNRGWLGGLFDIYGLQGILLAHVFFNVPLAARLLLSELERVPEESWKLAAQLQFRARDIWRIVEWPQLRAAIPGAALLIFLLCASSFAIVLTLGGGPRATTLEVAIYQALRADFDPPRAAALALVQLALCASLVAIAQRFGGLMQGWPSLQRPPQRFDGYSTGARISDGAVIAAGLGLLMPPLLTLAISGAMNIAPTPDLGRAIFTSLLLGTASAALAFVFVWPLAAAAARLPRWRTVSRLAVLSAWIIPPAVLATGWFISLSRVAGLSGLAPFLVIGMNGLMAMPFAYQILAPALFEAAGRHDRLCASLGIVGWSRLRHIDIPALRRSIGLALVMSLILSLGDLTAIALFGSQDLVTLPALIYRQMGSYRFDAAIGTALLLSVMVFALSVLAERWSARA